MNKDIQQILSSGQSQVFTIDPDNKTEIQRKTIDAVMRESRNALSSKRKVHIILVKS